jgi:hypothetical protein
LTWLRSQVSTVKQYPATNDNIIGEEIIGEKHINGQMVLTEAKSTGGGYEAQREATNVQSASEKSLKSFNTSRRG